MLELRRLQILSTLAAEGTMTAAAARLYMTTSAVSQQIALLEREVGLPLLVRSGRSVALNDAGRALVAHYGVISGAIDAAEAHLRTFHSDVRGTIAIGTFPSFGSAILPDALMGLRRDHPQLQTSVRDMEPTESVSQVRSGGLDVAVVDDLHALAMDGLVSGLLARDELVLCLPPGEPVQSAPADLAEYADASWIFDTDAAFAEYVRSMCRQAGFEPRVVAQCSNLVATVGLVRAGYGVALVSELNLGPTTQDLVVRRVLPACERRIRVVTRASSQQAPSVRAVIRALRAATKERYERRAEHG